jgi:outer membrane receptor protein involved in Fe transport
LKSRKAGARRIGVVAGLAIGLAAGSALASPLYELNVRLQPRKEALIDFARQAGLSLGFRSDLKCPGSAEVAGRMTAAQALDRLLAGSGCRAVRLDDHTYAVETAPRRTPAVPPGGPVGPASAVDVGEVVVTATKEAGALREAPYALTAISGADLARQDIFGDGDLSVMAAGVTVTNLGPGRDKVIFRGLADSPLTGHTQSTVGIYLDELRLTYNAPDPDLRLVDVARVEVLRGPQGTLYGSGSIGGVLQVSANPPDSARRYSWAEVYGAATQEGAPTGGAEGVFNAPLARGAGAMRFAGWAENTGGYIDNLATGRRDVDRTRRLGGRASLAWSPTHDLDLSLELVDQSINSRDTHYAQPLIGTYERATPNAEPHDNDFLALDLTARWRLDWADLTLSSGVLEHDVASRYDATAGPPALALPGDAPNVFDDDNDIKGFVNEARIVSRNLGKVRFLLGAFGAFGGQDLTSAMTGVSGATGYQEQRRDRLAETALFGEASYDLSARWSLTAGARIFRSRVSTRSLVSVGASASRFDGLARDTGVAPKLLVSYRPSGDATFYLQAAQGYRAGGFNTAGLPGQAFGSTIGDQQPLRHYQGDSLWNYEAGARAQAADGSWRLRAAAFYSAWNNIQADLLLPSGLPFTANIGDGQSYGLELEGGARLGPFSASANLILQDPSLDQANPGFPARPDSRLPGVPKAAFGAAVSYDRPLAGGWRLELASRYGFVGGSRLTFDDQTAPHMGAYGDLHASAAVARAPYRLELFADNLTGAHGDTFAYGNPFSLRSAPQTTPQPPRTVGLRVRRDF